MVGRRRLILQTRSWQKIIVKPTTAAYQPKVQVGVSEAQPFERVEQA